ncbi:MAG TPA: beta-ketoacyl-ACP synthase III, partial [Planctomycetota bacterium]|nr:beta-ketoacyl-ACP synthase III [Planctomycetota bacterium]
MSGRQLQAVRVAGTGSYLPERVVTNDDFRKAGLDTDDEWVRTRTGIRERRFAKPEQAASDLALEACKRALEAAECSAADVDVIICGTMTGDYVIPCTAALLQRGLNAEKAGGFDLSAACSGFVLSLQAGAHYIQTGSAKKVLVVGAEKMSYVVDQTKRDTAVLFGDGAGAALLVQGDGSGSDLLATRCGLRGDHESLVVPSSGSRCPVTPETIEKRLNLVHMKGRETFKFAVSTFVDLIQKTCAEAGVTPEQLAVVVPHQVNLRILESACEKSGVPMSKLHLNIDRVGNTSAASVGIALDECVRAGRIR